MKSVLKKVVVLLGVVLIGVLAWTAAGMIANEPHFEDFFAERPSIKNALYPLIIGGVLGFAWLRRPRKEVLQ